MADPAEDPQRRRKLRVALLALGVEHLGAIEEQQDLPAGQLQPRQRLRGDVAERAAGPEARDFGRRQRPADRFLRDFLGVEPLELRRAAAETDRRVGAVGVRVVADVEIRSELRRRQVEAAVDRVVPDDDRRRSTMARPRTAEAFYDVRRCSAVVLRSIVVRERP